jgi:predicted DNA-binding protein (UPF0251 family)
MSGKEIRRLIRKSGLYQYEVAYAMGVNEQTFIRWLRKPLEKEKEKAIVKVIGKLKEQNAPRE